MDYNALLKRFYTALLEAANPELMGAVHTFRADGVIGLDDIFLPGVSDGYGEAPLKVMVIGRERHYRYRAPRAEAPAANARPALSIREYVEHGMRRHEEVRTEIFVKDAHDSDLLGLLVSVAKAIKTEESPLVQASCTQTCSQSHSKGAIRARPRHGHTSGTYRRRCSTSRSTF